MTEKCECGATMNETGAPIWEMWCSAPNCKFEANRKARIAAAVQKLFLVEKKAKEAEIRADERAKMTNAKILEYLRTPEGKQQYFDNFGERIDDIERKAYLDGQNQMTEKADAAFRKVFDKIQEHRKAHKGNCNCPACNPTIPMLYAEFIGELQASERPKEGRK